MLLSQLTKSVDVEVDDEEGTTIKVSFPVPNVTPSMVDRAETIYYRQLLGDDDEETDEDLDSLDTEGLDEAQQRDVLVARWPQWDRAEKRMTQDQRPSPGTRRWPYWGNWA